MRLVLASGSPRRRELLATLGVPFDVCPAPIDETPENGEAPGGYVSRMAREKADAGWQALTADRPDTWVMGADTSVVVDDQILGKPTSADHAADMLKRLSGRRHQVLTAVALKGAQDARVALSTSHVTFHHLTDAEIQAYWRTGEPADKAGAYGIQGLGARFVRHLEGNYHAVVGLPVDLTADLLNRAGFLVWQTFLEASGSDRERTL